MSIFLSVQVSLVAEERDRNISRVQELEASITELKNAAGKRVTLSYLVCLHFPGFPAAPSLMCRTPLVDQLSDFLTIVGSTESTPLYLTATYT